MCISCLDANKLSPLSLKHLKGKIWHLGFFGLKGIGQRKVISAQQRYTKIVGINADFEEDEYFFLVLLRVLENAGCFLLSLALL